MSAAASSAVASAGAAVLHPPTSQFSGLLKRSRFASFDPAIRQAYGAPSSHAHRGNYGLKKPINLRRRNAYISLAAPFESRAEYIDWSNAESQVRFVQRYEEMQRSPRVSQTSPWQKTLGSKNRTDWMMDSEFCSRSEGPEVEEQEVQPVTSEALYTPPTVDLESLGRGYRSTVRAVPNIYAMSNTEFEKYVKKLRALRPEFTEFVGELSARHSIDDQPNFFAGKSLYELAAKFPSIDQHRIFLSKHTAKTFQDPTSRAIEPRPHRNGGLQYAHLSPLHSRTFAKFRPGILLHKIEKRDTGRNKSSSYVASFGGIVGRLNEDAVRNTGGESLLDISSEKGLIDREQLDAAVIPMRLAASSLMSPPTVVGRRPQGLKGVDMENEMEVEGTGHHIVNPYPLGSPAYVGVGDSESSYKATTFAEKVSVAPTPRNTTANFAKDFANLSSAQKIEKSNKVLTMLSGMLGPKRNVGGDNGEGL